MKEVNRRERGLKISLESGGDIRYNYSGVPYHMYEYGRFLSDNGFQVEMIVPKSKRPRAKIRNYSKLHLRYKDIPEKRLIQRFITLPMWRPQIYEGLPKDSVIYFATSIYDSIIMILTKPNGQKYMIGCHNMFLVHGSVVHEALKRMRDLLVKIVLYMIGAEKDNIYFHVINRGQAKYLHNIFGVSNRNIFYAPPMIDAHNYYHKENNSSRLLVIHIGGLAKDAGTVLAIIDELKEKKSLSKFEFYFVGKMPTALAKKYKRLDNVHFLGAVGEKEKYEVLSKVDAIIIPGSECFPKTMLEGLASGLYVLTSWKNGAWNEISKLKIPLTVVKNSAAGEYIAPLLEIARAKQNARFNRSNMHSRKIIAREFDKSTVMPMVLRMFSVVADLPDK